MNATAGADSMHNLILNLIILKYKWLNDAIFNTDDKIQLTQFKCADSECAFGLVYVVVLRVSVFTINKK